MPHSETTTFTLPDAAGIYRIYVRYYSTTGHASNMIFHDITYTGAGAGAPAAVSAPATPAAVPVAAFLQNLRRYDVNSDVKRLQQYLNANGFVVAKTGAGSPGNETMYFGMLTEQALMRFQKSHAADLDPSAIAGGAGRFGPSTRGYINAHP